MLAPVVQSDRKSPANGRGRTGALTKGIFTKGAANSSPAASETAIFKDTIMIKDRPFDRAFEGIVIYPLNVQELAEKAWPSVNKEMTIGGVRVKVRAFSR
jgi:hypothetical protein